MADSLRFTYGAIRITFKDFDIMIQMAETGRRRRGESSKV
jgi:hypothetical protein